MKIRLWGAVLLAKLWFFHYKLGWPTEVTVPVSGGSTGIMWAIWEDRRRYKRKEF